VASRREHAIIAAEVVFNRFRFRRRFDNHQFLLLPSATGRRFYRSGRGRRRRRRREQAPLVFSAVPFPENGILETTRYSKTSRTRRRRGRKRRASRRRRRRQSTTTTAFGSAKERRKNTSPSNHLRARRFYASRFSPSFVLEDNSLLLLMMSNGRQLPHPKRERTERERENEVNEKKTRRHAQTQRKKSLARACQRGFEARTPSDEREREFNMCSKRGKK